MLQYLVLVLIIQSDIIYDIEEVTENGEFIGL